MKSFFLFFIIFSAQAQNLPPLNQFLGQLFDVASNEIETLADNFNFKEVAAEDIKFYFYTSPNFTQLTKLSKVDFSKPTKMLIHGWQSSGLDSYTKKMAENYHKRGVNFISVDWTEHSKKVYMHSASSTQHIGNILANFILTRLKNETDLQNIHIIGVSLGGHVAGFAGKRIYEKTGDKIGRITGLDVAGPLFEFPVKRSSGLRLHWDDAHLVDVIHTNVGFLGVSGKTGTADFYVENGGPIQPGCFDPLNIFESFACSHGKAFEYFLESINGKKFEAVKCSNSIQYHLLGCNLNEKVVMGEDFKEGTKGIFYLEVDSALPYGRLWENPLGLRINLPKLRLPFIN